MAWPQLPRAETPFDWRAAALQAARQFCGWHVAPVIEETLTLDGPGRAALLLPSNRVEEILSLTEDKEPVDVTTLEVSRMGILRKSNGKAWTRKLGAIEVTLRHGYDQYDDFAGIVEGVRARAAATGAGNLSETAGPFSVRRGTQNGEVVGIPLMMSEKAALAPYRLTWGA